ncbi:class I SAM-dependent methyltransferase [Asanoa iriomotensis]|uniref:Methyltransferase type 11 domain-containing protein n=1 Tax=Asanoa iriomotensis TaxID=234613 RepID=A0ABQ4C5N5_9ACTN|nr:class I SAM-dependent methyltransferase [Asanoa iriomotensis]GIF57731.1 hypothetical protein Air01nite_38260 [Asanoa iriomotensis]
MPGRHPTPFTAGLSVLGVLAPDDVAALLGERAAALDAEIAAAEQADSFDLVVCQAAFKNFASPVTALDEIHRVLRPGGVAVILDLNRGATAGDIRADVAAMRLNQVNSAVTRMTLTWLRRRAYAAADFARVAADSTFGGSAAHADGMTLEVRLTKAA